jgi:hypothetical protein
MRTDHGPAGVVAMVTVAVRRRIGGFTLWRGAMRGVGEPAPGMYLVRADTDRGQGYGRLTAPEAYGRLPRYLGGL